MNRTSTYKVHYISVLVVELIILLTVIMVFEVHFYGAILLGLLFAAPTRIGHHFLRDLFRGRVLAYRQHAYPLSSGG